MSRRSCISALCLVALLVALTGCEDKQARLDAAEAQTKINDLSNRLRELESSNAQMKEAVKSVHDKIAAQVNDRIDRVESSVISSSKELLTKLTQDAQSTRDTATQIVGTARSDYDKELTTFKTSLAGDIQKMREENKVQLDELKKYMDNQLRELYPYAYQPRRDSKAPPEPDTK